MKNNILKNGIFGGLIVSTIMTLMTLFMKSNPENEPSAIIGFISMFLAYIFIVLGIKKERDGNNGTITFSKAFVIGLSISLVISTIYVIVWLIIYYNFFPEFMEQYSKMVLKNTNVADLSAKTAEMNQMKEWYKNPLMVIVLTFIEILPIGIVVSLISALILKRN